MLQSRKQILPCRYLQSLFQKQFRNAVWANLQQIPTPQLLFQRALNLASSEEVNFTLHECLSYELYPVTMSIFDNNGFMRQAAKADLAKFLLTENVFLSSEEGAELMKHENCVKVLDGGALLHRVQHGLKKNRSPIS